MKRNILNMAVAAVSALMLLNSCDKDSEGKTRITYYPTIELNGETTMYVNKGDSYVEPGYTSFLNGENITNDVQVVSNVDESKSGVYSIKYITKDNEDGFGASATRKVVVLDFNDPIEGIYAVNSEVSKRDYKGTVAPFRGNYEVLLISNGDGTYNITDLFGGWYDQQAGYGSDYACGAVMEIDGAKVNVDPSNAGVPAWGDTIDAFHDASYSAATSTLTYQADYAESMTFFITLVKQPIE